MQFNTMPLLSTFKSKQTNKTFKISHRVNCKSGLLLIYWNAISVIFNSSVNQKHSTLGSITTEKMSKITMQCQLANISTDTIMILKITEKSLP